MRNVFFKNHTSSDKRKRKIASSEIIDRDGIRSIIRRHFVYMVKEVKNNNIDKPEPYLYVLKEKRSNDQKEKFFCRMKGSMYAVMDQRLFLILYMHSLKINLVATGDEICSS
ncbi:MAG: hypothetical protein KJ793_04325 [Candidatus Omnitrophica bacterium]|nr:hypothetical protein [Candidatus Omnitrophota bacterium]